jgi:uncharacterized protein YggE
MLRTIALATLVLALPLHLAHAQDGRERLRTISVDGAGTVAAKPELAEVQIGVATEARTAAAALNANTAAMNALFVSLRNFGIAEADMQTSGFHVGPKYEAGDRGRAPVIVGYAVTNQVAVKVRALDKLGELLDQVVQSGANSVHGVRFSLAKPDAAADLARKEAMADARRKAELLAAEARVKLGRIVSISEGGLVEPRPRFTGAEVRAAAAVPVAPGELAVRANLRVTWALE